MKKTITLRWTNDNLEILERKINRAEMRAAFDGLVVGFPWQNQNAKKLVELLPETSALYIDLSQNHVIRYIRKSKMETMEIDESNIVIWAIFRAYCKMGDLAEKFKLVWKIDGKTYSKEVIRKDVKAIFDKLIKEYPDTCTNSIKISSIVPIIDELYIDWDYTGDVNSIYYKIGNSVYNGISIKPLNKIVWRKLKELCM